MGSVTVSGWSSPESISEDLAEPGTRRYDMAAGLGGTTLLCVDMKLNKVNLHQSWKLYEYCSLLSSCLVAQDKYRLK